MGLADHISDAAANVSVAFPDEQLTLSLGELWETGTSTAALHAAAGGGRLGLVLANSSSCLTVLLGAIRAEVAVVSLPLPPRGSDISWYATFVESCCHELEVDQVVVEDQLLNLIPPLDNIDLVGYNQVSNWNGSQTRGGPQRGEDTCERVGDPATDRSSSRRCSLLMAPNIA